MRWLVLGCLLVTLLGATPVAGAQATPAETPTETSIVVHLEADGDAIWRVETAVPIEGSNETRAFRDLGEQFVEGDRQVAQGPATFERIATRVGDHTGRTMAIQDVNRSWRVENTSTSASGAPEQTRGVLSYWFTWSNFARTDGTRVIVGDAFDTDDRWLPGLRAGQNLVIEAPANYSITQASVGHTRTTVRWEGPTTFEPGTLRATFTSTNDTTPPNGSQERPLPISMEGLLAVLAAILLAGVAYGVARRSSGPEDPPATAGASPRADDPPEESGGGSSGDTGGPFVGIDENLLSDEERIERHLQSAGGRMKQAEIVDRTGWSNAKVSQVLSNMDEEGRVQKLRIGRENLISLPEEE